MICKICQVGFKMKENTSTSCKSHSRSYSAVSYKFNCCGLNPNITENVYCTVGYHTPQDYCFDTYEKYKKIKNKNKTTLL